MNQHAEGDPRIQRTSGHLPHGNRKDIVEHPQFDNWNIGKKTPPGFLGYVGNRRKPGSQQTWEHTEEQCSLAKFAYIGTKDSLQNRHHISPTKKGQARNSGGRRDQTIGESGPHPLNEMFVQTPRFWKRCRDVRRNWVLLSAPGPL